MFGLGGVFTELLKDVTYRFAPFDADNRARNDRGNQSRAAAHRLSWQRTARVDALADVVGRASRCSPPITPTSIAEIDINPLFVNTAGVVAADALIVLKH